MVSMEAHLRVLFEYTCQSHVANDILPYSNRGTNFQRARHVNLTSKASCRKGKSRNFQNEKKKKWRLRKKGKDVSPRGMTVWRTVVPLGVRQ